MLPHPQALLHRSAQDAHRASRLVEQIEQRGQRRQACLSSAARRPHDRVAGRLEVGVADVLERRAVMRTDAFCRDFQEREELNPAAQLVIGETFDQQRLVLTSFDYGGHGDSEKRVVWSPLLLGEGQGEGDVEMFAF